MPLISPHVREATSRSEPPSGNNPGTAQQLILSGLKVSDSGRADHRVKHSTLAPTAGPDTAEDKAPGFPVSPVRIKNMLIMIDISRYVVVSDLESGDRVYF